MDNRRPASDAPTVHELARFGQVTYSQLSISSNPGEQSKPAVDRPHRSETRAQEHLGPPVGFEERVKLFGRL
jgi:hypothetical protein